MVVDICVPTLFYFLLIKHFWAEILEHIGIFFVFGCDNCYFGPIKISSNLLLSFGISYQIYKVCG